MIRNLRTILGPGSNLRLFCGLGVCVLAVTLVGCESDDPVDALPPAVPTGVFSVTGDMVVSVYWNDIYEEDLIGYDVYRHDLDDPVNGAYHYLGTVLWNENYLEDSFLHWFDDFEVVNGETYYYAVLAFDEAGNESSLSFEYIQDTPRPEGEGVVLYDRGVDSLKSGFDFSRLQLGRQDSDAGSTDIFVEFSGGVPYVRVARSDGVEIQDFGPQLLINVDYAPVAGYSETGRLELIEGHSYVVRITDPLLPHVNYAKFQVVAKGLQSVMIDWAYQQDSDNRELSVPIGPVAGPASGRQIQRDDIVRF